MGIRALVKGGDSNGGKLASPPAFFAADARKTAAVVVGMVVLSERLIEIGAVAGEIRDVAHGEIEAAAGEFGDAAPGEIGAVDGEKGTKTVFALELFPLFP
ncbi:hypothetical protein LWI29_016365 [Acer saccharum]|uniref:Uncharacterized protein n=1 Tax=Acer saccharum TaxID=4024 RepID=A0AA39RHG3_ACESA|nr:hypothetical protein LWI29_016365 [Acer saccharum]